MKPHVRQGRAGQGGAAVRTNRVWRDSRNDHTPFIHSTAWQRVNFADGDRKLEEARQRRLAANRLLQEVA